ncbi:protein FAM162B isoform X1 [Bombus impatiens]|uniref:Protein FAM162B isoform X1 n=2 Tax=Bombus impatiens TaxID=132113 RepID=A0A6P8LVV9_BOMIM|nr:protein FAM162B isoform X1 [Bombus impatiens]
MHQMFCTRLIRQFKLLRIRQLHSTFVRNENKSVSEKSKTTETLQSTGQKEQIDFVTGPPMVALSNLDKRILVWVKRYPSLDQVPDYVSYQCIHHAHTKARIRICFVMMFLAIVICLSAVMIGKRDVAAGKNIATERMKWYTEVKEKGRREAAENAEKAK